MRKPNKRPMRVTIIAWLFIAYGVYTLANMFYDLSNSKIYLNFSVFMIPVGIGLLYGKRSSQWWAGTWIVIGYFGIALLVVVCLTQPSYVDVRFFDFKVRGPQAIPHLLLASTAFAYFLYNIHRLLFSPKANAYFKLIASRKRISLHSSADAREDEPSA